METYHFGRDLLDTYQSLTPLLQVLWLIVPPGFVCTLLAIWLRYRTVMSKHGLREGNAHLFDLNDQNIKRMIAQQPLEDDAPTLIAVRERE